MLGANRLKRDEISLLHFVKKKHKAFNAVAFLVCHIKQINRSIDFHRKIKKKKNYIFDWGQPNSFDNHRMHLLSKSMRKTCYQMTLILVKMGISGVASTHLHFFLLSFFYFNFSKKKKKHRNFKKLTRKPFDYMILYQNYAVNLISKCDANRMECVFIIFCQYKCSFLGKQREFFFFIQSQFLTAT